MELSINQIESLSISRRKLLQYGSILGISSISGLEIFEKSSSILDMPLSEVSSVSITDYSTSSYKVFLLSDNAGMLENMLSNSRIKEIYLYGKEFNKLSSRVKILNNVSSLILSLGNLLPFDYDVSTFDKKAYNLHSSFLYLSEVYADYQNGKLELIEEERILSSLKAIGHYNRTIYVAGLENNLFNTSQIINTNSEPIGSLVFI